MKRWRTDARAVSTRRAAALPILYLALLFAVPACAQDTAAKPAAPIATPAARTLSADKLKRIDAYLDNEIASRQIPGAIVLVQQHGKPVYFRCFGGRDVGSSTSMSPDTIFRLYSMSKPITSVAAMMLVEDGMLKLDDPVASYIPAFAEARVGIDKIGGSHPTLLLEPLNRPITIRDLLRHTSGITYGFYGDEPARKRYAALDIFRGDFDNAQLADSLAHLPLAEQPGTLWDYGHSTDVLGRVIEVVSKQSLYEFEKRRLLDPLGMRETSFYVTDPAKRPLIAEPMPEDRMVGPVIGMRDPLDVRRWESGGSGMVGTITDYARFAQMLLNGGTLDGKRYLSAQAVASMTSDQIGPGSGIARDYYYFPGAASGFGLGFAVRTSELASEPGPVGEYRWDGVGGTFFWIDPRDDMFVIFMAQTPSQRGRIQAALRGMVYEAME